MHGVTAGHGSSKGAADAAGARSRDRLRLLAEAIEAEIVPRLVAGHEPAPPPPWQPAQAAPADFAFTAIPQPAIELATLVLDEDETLGRAYIVEAVARLGLEPVCLTLLAPAARHLGDLWAEDICSFSDVTIGLMRLQSALLAVAAPLAQAPHAPSPRRTALLAPAPGDQHTFGLTMVAGFLERAGWSVTQLHDGTPESLESALRGKWFGVLGLSAGSTVKLASLPRMLPRLRAVSRNPNLGVMIGGPLFVAQPALATELGADGTAADGPNAVLAAESLIAPQRVHRGATG
jgi:methanogenic corrinoid protein MtbC1